MFATLLWLACAGGGEAAAPAPAGPAPALVELAAARDGALTDAWTTPGEVVALDAAELAFGAAGPLARAPVREGDRVTRGQLLAELDVDLALARLRAAEAAEAEGAEALAQARRALERAEAVQAGVLAPLDLEQARSLVAQGEARLQALTAAVSLARAEWGRHRLLAPFDGVVTARRVDPGDWVAAGQIALELLSAEDLELRVQASEALAMKLAPGLRVSVEGRGEGEVVAVVPALDPVSRTALVRVRPLSGAYVPGESLPVRFPVTWEGEGVLVPRDALVLDAGGARVMRVVEGVAESVAVEVLARGEADALVTAPGLAAGDALVVRGNERLRPGQPVKPRGDE